MTLFIVNDFLWRSLHMSLCTHVLTWIVPETSNATYNLVEYCQTFNDALRFGPRSQ